jgi:hypothetical protein
MIVPSAQQETKSGYMQFSGCFVTDAPLQREQSVAVKNVVGHAVCRDLDSSPVIMTTVRKCDGSPSFTKIVYYNWNFGRRKTE